MDAATPVPASEARGGASPWTRRLLVLGALLILVGAGVALYNLWPDVSYRLGFIDQQYPYPSLFAQAKGETPKSKAMPSGTRLVVPEIGVDVRIYEGDADTALDLGVYRHPRTGTPGEPANTAVAGHRMADRFALLHVLEPGDEVIVYWDGVEHDYLVGAVGEIPAGDVSILRRGDDERLTLYTCTPRWLGDRRTVVVALPAP